MSTPPVRHDVARSALVGLGAAFTVGFVVAFLYLGALWLVGIAIMLALGTLVGYGMSRRA